MEKQLKRILNKIIGYFCGVVALFLVCIFAGINPIVALLIISAFVYLKFLEAKKPKKTPTLHIMFLFVVGLTAILWIRYYTNFSPFFIPLPAIAMLAIILLASLEIALLISLCLSIFAGFMFHVSLHLTLILFIGSVVAVLFSFRIRQRYQLIKAGVGAGLAMAACWAVITYRNDIGMWSIISPRVIPLFLNGIMSAFFVAGALPIFEFLFGTVTNISLLELSDFNHPLLKRLVLEAPGTYHHSLLVGNLAEMAAEAVNANSLLARVGAYYHDIGKLEKPGYFSENQERVLWRHEQLAASMSRLVIINHVKDGLGLAKKYKLNSAIIDFIEQHHGTSIVFYFYRRALEQLKDEQEVSEESFRYPGPKPQTKETAIVLLADSAEAACRALDEPNAQRIEEVVHTVINNKFIDGQLDECDLTLKDLHKIAGTFTRILSAIYHTRIEYPEPTSETTSQKFPKEDEHQSGSNQKDS